MDVSLDVADALRGCDVLGDNWVRLEQIVSKPAVDRLIEFQDDVGRADDSVMPRYADRTTPRLLIVENKVAFVNNLID